MRVWDAGSHAVDSGLQWKDQDINDCFITIPSRVGPIQSSPWKPHSGESRGGPVRPPGHLMAMPGRRTKICSPFLVLLSYLIWKSPTGIISCFALFSGKNKKAWLINPDRCILGSETGVGKGVLIPYSRSFFTRIPHPELLSSLSRIWFSSGSRTSVENLLDQHASEALISFVHITCTTYCFRRKGHCCHHPYCFPSQSQTLFAIDATSPVKVKSVKSRIPLTFPKSSAVFWADP